MEVNIHTDIRPVQYGSLWILSSLGRLCHSTKTQWIEDPRDDCWNKRKRNSPARKWVLTIHPKFLCPTFTWSRRGNFPTNEIIHLMTLYQLHTLCGLQGDCKLWSGKWCGRKWWKWAQVFIPSLSQTNQCTGIINKVRYICNPYIRFGNQVAILKGRIKESQVSMTSRYTHIWH
jgi:hypothetical protein